MRYGSRTFAALSALALLVPAPGDAARADAAQTGKVTAVVTGLRSARGNVLACLTARPQDFPECDRDPHARKLTVAAGETVSLAFGPVPHGRYAISIFHDENANGKLDKRLILPREGYGFSRDAPVRMGPPSFDSAAFSAGEADLNLSIRMRYLL